MLFIVTSCTLEKEPLFPDGYTNENNPVFSTVEVTATFYDSIQLKAKLSSKGDLNIIQYGCVWSEMRTQIFGFVEEVHLRLIFQRMLESVTESNTATFNQIIPRDSD